ncbi:MAG: glycosyltransferase family 2 protein, partial [Cyanobacteria bacterium P01_H01_bin.105]
MSRIVLEVMPLPSVVPSVAAIIPTYNRWAKTQRFLQQFVRQSYADLTIVVVDANSPDGTAKNIRQQYPDVVVLQVDDQHYWAGATNAGISYALNRTYDYILTINDDAMVAFDHVQHLVVLAQSYGLAILGNRIDYVTPPGKVWALGTQLIWGTPNFLRLQYHDVDVKDLPVDVMAQKIVSVHTLPGDGVLIHRSVFEKVGLYQSNFLPHYHADSELILRAKKHGFQAYVAPHVVLKDDFSVEQKKQDLKSIAGLRYAFFHPRSHLFLSAIAYIFFRYCPWYAYPKTLYYLAMRLLLLSKGR